MGFGIVKSRQLTPVGRVFLLRSMGHKNWDLGEFAPDVPLDPNRFSGRYFEGRIFANEADLKARFRFNDEHGEWAFFRGQMTLEGEPWPIAVLESFEVPEHERKQHKGTEAMLEFIKQARAKGARVAFLWVGNCRGENPAEDWKVSWYPKFGWRLLKNPPGDLVMPWMYLVC